MKKILFLMLMFFVCSAAASGEGLRKNGASGIEMTSSKTQSWRIS